MPRVVLDFDPPQPEAPAFAAETDALVYFLSWAFSARYGANHELSLAALVLRGEFSIDLTPLLTFADREVEDEEDQSVLDRSWQDPAPLAECCAAVAAALGSGDKRLENVAEEYPGLAQNVSDLGRLATWAVEQGARIRVTYVLSDD